MNAAVGSNALIGVIDDNDDALQVREERGAPMIMLIVVRAMRKSVSVRAARWYGSLLSK